MDPKIIPLLIIVGFFVVFITMMVLMFTFMLRFAKKAVKKAKIKEEERQGMIQTFATQMGFKFSPDDNPGIIPEFRGFDYFNNDHKKRANNVLEGTFEGFPWMIFDYSYIIPGGTGRGRSTSTTYYQTIFCVYVSDFIFPLFAMGPENFAVGVAEKLGVFRDIDFDDFPDFSKNFCLIGKDEGAVREFLKPDILRFFESMGTMDFTLEADGDKIIFYNMGEPFKRAAPENIQVYMKKLSPIVNAFKKAHQW